MTRLRKHAMALCLAAAATHAVAAPRTIAVLDCTLIDDNAAYNDAETNRIQQARIAMISDDLRSQLRERQLYNVVDNAPARDMIAKFAATQDLNACNGCELEVGRKLAAEWSVLACAGCRR
jgi:Protein of unknown function (DUF2380)